MKHRFNISMAEVAEQDRHQAAQLALAYVSHDAQQVDITLNKLLSYIHEQAGMYYVVEHDMDVLQFS